MENVVKQCVGIDVSKDTIDCCIGTIDSNQQMKFGKSKKFENEKKGFDDMLAWVEVNRKSSNLYFVMEATGVYYENLAYFIDSQNLKLSVILPSMVKYFAKSINVKTKTDSKDAEVLSQLGLERKLNYWNVPTKLMRQIKLLCREYREIKAKIVVVKNQLHAKKRCFGNTENIEKRLEQQLILFESQSSEIEKEIKELSMSDPEFYVKVERICTLPGVQFMTVICILAETNGFALVKNVKQVVSYAGMDIQHNQSGIKEGKSRISKKGNGFIRNALYMPALSASKHNEALSLFYNQLKDRKPAKKIAVTAVARKLLILIYILWKNNTKYEPNYEKNRQTEACLHGMS